MSIRITGMNSGMDTDSMVKELVNAYEKQGEKYTKAKTKTEWKQEAWKTLNSKIKSFYSKYADTMRYSSAYKKKTTTVSNSAKASVIAGDNAVKGTQRLKINEVATAGYQTSLKLDGVTGSTKLSEVLGKEIAEGTQIKINIGTNDSTAATGDNVKTITVNSDTTLDQFAKTISSIDGLTASFDSANGRFFISSDNTGLENNFNFVGNSVLDGDGNETSVAGSILNSLGLIGEGTAALKTQGSDARITLNGAEFTSSSNTFSINGLTITAKEETADDETLTISTEVDVESIYNSIKSFIKEYNSLINELDKLYNAKDVTVGKNKYEPLTDEEKEAMTDDEIEKWETKIKDSLFSGDSDVEKIASAMKNSMLKGYKVEVNGIKTTYSLASFGIETLGYFDSAENEKNAFHIAGDSDDEYSSSGADKLKSMIASNPEAVEGFFTQLVSGLYSSLNKIQSSSDNYTSYGSFYSDKKLQSDYDTQNKQVTKWEEYVADIESKYYKQFTAMETAMGKLQDQQTSLSQLLGG